MTDERQAGLREALRAIVDSWYHDGEIRFAASLGGDSDSADRFVDDLLLAVAQVPEEERLLRVALERAIDAMDTVREGMAVTDPSAIQVGAASILRHAAREGRRPLGVESKDEGAAE